MTNQEKLLKTKLSMILTKEELDRITFVDEDNKEIEIEIDMHQLPAKRAMVLLNNVINLDASEKTVKVIHGYTHGTAIKNTIWNCYQNPRIIKKRTEAWNPGITILETSALA